MGTREHALQRVAVVLCSADGIEVEVGDGEGRRRGRSQMLRDVGQSQPRSKVKVIYVLSLRLSTAF